MKQPRPIARPASLARTEGAARRPVTWSEIERAILLRIARKEYVPGQQIPTCEALAAEFGANKNTVSKAYRSLAQRGYLLTRAGFGTFISKRPVRISLDSAVDGIVGLLALAVQEAKLGGLGQSQFGKLVDDVVAQGYGHSGPRVGFIECNHHDATVLSRDLQIAVAHPIEPLLIDDVVAEPQRFLREFDILAVTISHLSAVETALGAHHESEGAALVYGMHVPIDPESLLKVARLRAGTKVGVICDLKPTLVSLTGMVAGCNPALAIDGCLTGERARLKRLVAGSDVLLVTPSATQRVRETEPQVPVVELAFRADVHSVEQLAALIAERGPAAVGLTIGTVTRRAAGS